jgi:trk system potassium uptake protein TrkA
MRAVIAGAGRLGSQAARTLTEGGYTVTVVDQDGVRLAAVAALAEADGRPLGRALVGDACEPSVLEEAGALNVDLLVAATGEDEDNLVISLLAKRQFAVPHVVARINDMDNEWLFGERWGVDVKVPAAMPLISLIEEAAGVTDTVAVAHLSRAGVSVIEATLAENSRTVGHLLGDVTLPAGVFVATVIRASQPITPDPQLLLQAGDAVLIVSATATAEEIHGLFQ